jgi:hypothetical protein
MGIPPGQYVQGTLNQRFVRPHQFNGRSVQREASGVLFLMVHGDAILRQFSQMTTGVMSTKTLFTFVDGSRFIDIWV